MIDVDANLAIIGSGFGGSFCALIARRMGMSVALVERGAHPRFALGESSTPVANLALESLSRRFDLPRLTPMAHYGPWRRTYPDIMRGLKRGFSYFHHAAGTPFSPRADHANELMMAANPDAERGDTHWLRADVDAFIVREAVNAGAVFLDRTQLEMAEHDRRWVLRGRRLDEQVHIDADFVIDASGDGGFLARTLSLPSRAAELHTHSRCIYSHFRGVGRWHDVLTGLGARVEDHPFACDDAALHHVFDGGWMFVLRFDNGVTSAGFSLDPRRFPLDDSRSPDEEWASLLSRFPSIHEQFCKAEPTRPLRRTGRLQRMSARAAGPNWAMLPTAAGIIDALHSTGNAHTLTGIERLMPILIETNPGERRTERLAEYERAILAEIGLIDRLVHGGYQLFGRFEAMAAYSMLYFAAVTFTEHARRESRSQPGDGFLLSHDARFTAMLNAFHTRACELGWDASDGAIRTFANDIRHAIAPYNRVGLCDDTRCNLYPYV